MTRGDRSRDRRALPWATLALAGAAAAVWLILRTSPAPEPGRGPLGESSEAGSRAAPAPAGSAEPGAAARYTESPPGPPGPAASAPDRTSTAGADAGRETSPAAAPVAPGAPAAPASRESVAPAGSPPGATPQAGSADRSEGRGGQAQEASRPTLPQPWGKVPAQPGGDGLRDSQSDAAALRKLLEGGGLGGARDLTARATRAAALAARYQRLAREVSRRDEDYNLGRIELERLTRRRDPRADALRRSLLSQAATLEARSAEALKLLRQVESISGPAPDARGAPPPALGPGVSPGARAAVQTAYAQLGKPYVWAADGPQSFDCSGLTLFAWAKAGVRLPHSSRIQFGSLPHVPFAALQPGDLMFFGSPIHHVSMYIGDGRMIHSPSTGDVVRIVSASRSDFAGAARPGTR